MCVVTWSPLCYRCVASHFSCLVGAQARSVKPGKQINTLGYHSCTQAVGPDLVVPEKPPCHPQGGVCYDIKNHMSWICCHQFIMSCGYMGKVCQKVWEIYQYTEMSFIHPSCGTRFGSTCKTTMPSLGGSVCYDMKKHRAWMCYY